MDFHDKNKKGQEPQNTVSDWEKPFERPDPDAPQPVSEVWEDSEEAFDKAKETLKTEEAVNIEEAVKAEETLKVEEASESEMELPHHSGASGIRSCDGIRLDQAVPDGGEENLQSGARKLQRGP